MPIGYLFTDHDNKSKAVVENQTKGVSKVLESIKLGTLHDGFEHGFDNEPGVPHNVIIGDVQANEGLKEANDDNYE